MTLEIGENKGLVGVISDYLPIAMTYLSQAPSNNMVAKNIFDLLDAYGAPFMKKEEVVSKVITGKTDYKAINKIKE